MNAPLSTDNSFRLSVLILQIFRSVPPLFLWYLRIPYILSVRSVDALLEMPAPGACVHRGVIGRSVHSSRIQATSY